MGKHPEVGGRRNPGVLHAARLLRRLAASTEPLTAAALARAVDVPRSTVYEILASLSDEGLVARVPTRHAWTLGVGVFELGSAYLRHEPLEHLARPELARLTGAVGETSQLGVLDGHELLYLLRHQPPTPVPLVSDVGVRLPAHLTASGRILLAHLPRAQVTAVVRRPGGLGDTRTGHGPTTRQELDRLMRAERLTNSATEDGFITPGIVSVASAVFDHSERPVASIAVPHRREDRVGMSTDAIRGRVRHTADVLTRRLGGDPPATRT